MASMVNPAIKMWPEEIKNINTATGTSIAKDTHANHGLGEKVNLAPGIDLPSKIGLCLQPIQSFCRIQVLNRSNCTVNIPHNW